MTMFLAAGVAVPLVLIGLWLVSEHHEERRVLAWPGVARPPFDLGPAWHRADHGPRGHRAAPDPGRDWVVW